MSAIQMEKKDIRIYMPYNRNIGSPLVFIKMKKVPISCLRKIGVRLVVLSERHTNFESINTRSN